MKKRPDDIELGYFDVSNEQAVRLHNLQDAVHNYLEQSKARYPNLINRILKGNKAIEEVLHRDFAELKRELHRRQIRTTREELTRAFRNQIETETTSFRNRPDLRSKLFYNMFGVFHKIIHGDPGLKYLYPRREVTDNRHLVRHGPVEPGILAQIATEAATRELKRQEEELKFDTGPEDPAAELRFALRTGASAVFDALETHEVLPSRAELMRLVDGVRMLVDRDLKQISPHHARLLPAPRTTPMHARQMLAELDDRVADHRDALTAKAVRFLPASTATDRVLETLKSLGVPEKAAPEFAKHLHALGSPGDAVHALKNSQRVALFLHKTANHWMGTLEPHEFGKRVRALTSFVVKQPYHAVTESVLTDLRKEADVAAEREVRRLHKPGMSYEELYASHPKVGALKDYAAVLHLATAELAEERARQRPHG